MEPNLMDDNTAAESAKRIAEIRERESKATAGPWVRKRLDLNTVTMRKSSYGIRAAYVSSGDVHSDDQNDRDEKERLESDTDFIAHSRADIPYLLSRVTALEAELKAERKERCEHCGSDRIYSGPPNCPTCGAPNCCQTCCAITALEADKERLKLNIKSVEAKLAEADSAATERERLRWQNVHADFTKAQSELSTLRRQVGDVVRGLLLSADSSWGGHDWKESVLRAEQFLNQLATGKEGEK